MVSTSLAVAVVDVVDVEDFVVAGRVASEFPADAVAPLLVRLLERRPAPSLRSEAVLERVLLVA